MRTLLRLLFLLVALGHAAIGQAQSLREPNMDTRHEIKLPALVQQSTYIVEARAGDMRSFWNQEHSNIYTATTLEVYKVFKGELSGSTLELVTPGGWVGGTGMGYTHGFSMAPNTVGVFFLRLSQQPSVGTALPAEQIVENLYGGQGFIIYSGNTFEHNAAYSHFRLYPDIEHGLYPLVQGLTGRPYAAKKYFDAGRFDKGLEQRTGVKAANEPVPAPNGKKNGSSSGSLNRTQAVSIFAFSDPATTAGTFTPFTIYGSGFLNPARPSEKPVVKFRNAESFISGQPVYITCPAVNITGFSDSEIHLTVPSNDGLSANPSGTGGAGTGFVQVESVNGSTQSPQELVITRSEFTVDYPGVSPQYMAYRQTRLINQNGQGGYTFKYDPSLYNTPPAVDAIQGSLAQWRCATTVNFGDDVARAVPYNTTDAVCNVGFVAQSDPTTAMQTKITFQICSPTAGEYYVFSSVFDVEINPDYQWSYLPTPPSASSGLYDFRTDMLHEVGHAVGLRHVLDRSKVMYYNTPPGTSRRTLNTEPELNGASSALSRSQTVRNCNSGSAFQPHTPLTSATCQGAHPTVNMDYITVDRCTSTPASVMLTASGGSSYVWASKDHFNNTNPTSSTVTASTAPYTPIGVYSTLNGLGGTALVPIYFQENFQCPPPLPTGIAATSTRTTAYPNPSTGDFTVSYQPAPGVHDVEFTLHDGQGTPLKTFRLPANSQPKSFPLQGLRSGLYYLRTVENGLTHSTLHLQVQ